MIMCWSPPESHFDARPLAGKQPCTSRARPVRSARFQFALAASVPKWSILRAKREDLLFRPFAQHTPPVVIHS
jgi:hypothetical protein